MPKEEKRSNVERRKKEMNKQKRNIKRTKERNG